MTVYAYGGGKASAAMRPVTGRDDVMLLFTRLATMLAAHPSHFIRFGLINGLPGFVTLEHGGILQTTALEIGPDGIAGVYITRNPDKLRHMHVALH